MSQVKLDRDTVLQNRWRVLKKLAEGGFGAVYEAMDEKEKTKVALKLETADLANANPVLKVEVAVLLRLRGKSKHVCGIVGAGTEIGKYNFIAMQLVGPSLDSLHKSRPGRKFTESTTIRLARQCLRSIEDLHSIGFIHRDIKPGNFAIGKQKSNRRIVYLLDFGLARWIRNNDRQGEIENRRPRDVCGFRGTVRYASSAAHDGIEVRLKLISLIN